jgi:hypothetical protein
MGIASSRTTDTGVFIKPTAETGWKEISLLQKRKKRSSPLVELDVFFFDLSELVFQPCSFFLILLAFPKIPASAAANQAHIITITTTINTIVSYSNTLLPRLLTALFLPLNNYPWAIRPLFESAKQRPGHSRFAASFEEKPTLIFPMTRSIPHSSEMAPQRVSLNGRGIMGWSLGLANMEWIPRLPRPSRAPNKGACALI